MEHLTPQPAVVAERCCCGCCCPCAWVTEYLTYEDSLYPERLMQFERFLLSLRCCLPCCQPPAPPAKLVLVAQPQSPPPPPMVYRNDSNGNGSAHGQSAEPHTSSDVVEKPPFMPPINTAAKARVCITRDSGRPRVVLRTPSGAPPTVRAACGRTGAERAEWTAERARRSAAKTVCVPLRPRL